MCKLSPSSCFLERCFHHVIHYYQCVSIAILRVILHVNTYNVYIRYNNNHSNKQIMFLKFWRKNDRKKSIAYAKIIELIIFVLYEIFDIVTFIKDSTLSTPNKRLFTM